LVSTQTGERTRRAGWVGCNLDLHRIAPEARIAVVRTIASSSPPSGDLSRLGNGERNSAEGEGPRGPSEREQASHWIRGEVARLKSPRPDPLPAGRGEGNNFQTVIVPPEEVRARYTRLKPIREIKTAQRGWTLDVFNVVAAVCDRRKLSGAHRAPLQSWKEFTTADVYAFTRELEKLHPDNRHVRDKIRQQLQVLRDAELLIHVESGRWRPP
jgi:hypothetical protein